jgi:Flp pilus assembly protein TadB
MLELMKRHPWGKPDSDDDPSTLAAYEEFRRYRELTRRHQDREKQQEQEARQYWERQRRRYQRQERLRRFGLSTLAGFVGCAAVWAVWAYLSASLLPVFGVFGSSPSVAQVRSSTYFRNCAAARAAGAAPIRRGQPGYAPHLDRDDDGIACEWSWRNWFW